LELEGRRPVALAVLAGALASAALATPDWPHWRGPQHNGVTTEQDLPVRWQATADASENVAWKLDLPAVSGSTPIITGDSVLLNVGEGDELELWSVDRTTGAVRWRRPLGAGNVVTRKQNMSSPSPVTDGSSVWVLTGTGIVAGFGLDGAPKWRRDLQEEYGAFGLNWGYASSPLLVDGVLYVQVLHGMRTDDPSYVLALDGADGTTRWRVERPTDAQFESPDSYTTPALLEAHGRRELVISGGDYVTGHDLASGRELWRLGGLNPEKQGMYRIVASPVALGEWLWVPSRVSPLLAFRLPATGPPELVWSTDRGPDVPTPATDGKSLYLLNDRGILRRLDARTGEEQWEPQRLAQGTYSASPVIGDGKLYAISEDGIATVAAIDGAFEILATNTVSGYTLASPAVAGGQLFLRTADALYCIGRGR
jgi:outer membrane protein assembly factor BamB